MPDCDGPQSPQAAKTTAVLPQAEINAIADAARECALPRDASLGRTLRCGAFRRRPFRRRPPSGSPPQLLAGEAGTLDQRLELRPHDLRMHARKIGDLREAAIGA